MDQRIGRYGFTIGVLLAIILGVASPSFTADTIALMASILVVCGLIVGLFNVGQSETKDFLLFAVVLIIAAGMGSASSTLGNVSFIGEYLAGVFSQMLAFIVPATIIVALRSILVMEQDGTQKPLKKRKTKTKTKK